GLPIGGNPELVFRVSSNVREVSDILNVNPPGEGLLLGPGGSFSDDYLDLNFVNQNSFNNVEWDGVTNIHPVVAQGQETQPDADTVLLLHMNGNSLDSSNNGHPVSETGGITCNSIGMFNQACTFDGLDDYLTVEVPGLIEGLPALTISAWVKNAAPASGDRYVTSVGGNIMYFRLENDGRYLFAVYNDTGSVGQIKSDNRLDDTNWHHLVGVYDGSNVKLYVDGVLQSQIASLTGTIERQNNVLKIGALGSGRLWNGLIDEFAVWQRALSETEIQQLYSQGSNSVSGSFESTLIDMGGQFNVLDASWVESTPGATRIEISADNGQSWCEVTNGGQITDLTCQALQQASNFIYRASFSDITDLDSVTFSWSSQQCTDVDQDGYSNLGAGSCCGASGTQQCNVGVDCNDNDASIHPGAVEIPNDGIDQDCDGQDLVSTEFYVDKDNPNCDDTGPGTQAQPFCTIQAGADAATVPGSTVYILGASTPYVAATTNINDNVLKVTASGTSAAPISFVGVKDAVYGYPVLDGQSAPQVFANDNVVVSQGDWVSFSNLIVKNGGCSGFFIQGDNNHISNSIAEYNGLAPGTAGQCADFHAEFVDALTIENAIARYGLDGFAIKGSTNVLLRNVISHSHPDPATRAMQVGSCLACGEGECRNGAVGWGICNPDACCTDNPDTPQDECAGVPQTYCVQDTQSSDGIAGSQANNGNVN
ncbi:hypothetical protein D6817_04000, partial [Candidatus Pacearchaeota archaeon]